MEEDEETRAYRLEIEKQKAMREKILKDKETRRRKAAEVIKAKDEVCDKIDTNKMKLTRGHLILIPLVYLFAG